MEEILERIRDARFTTTDEIYAKRVEIREIVQSYDYDTQEIYKWYFFFQLCILKNPLKTLLWNYVIKETINKKDEEKLTLEYCAYKRKCKKILKINAKRKEKEEKMGTKEKETVKINSVEDIFKLL